MTLIEINGKNYVRVGDKLIEVDKNGEPVQLCWSEETPNENGGMDCTIHVPCLQIAATPHKPE